MSDFGKKILNRLLDKYENSVISKKGSNRNIKITLNLKDKELSTYVCKDSYNYRDANDAILALYQHTCNNEHGNFCQTIFHFLLQDFCLYDNQKT